MVSLASGRRQWVVLAAVVLVGAAVRIYGLGSVPFWLDEAHSANFIRLPFSRLWSWENPYDLGNPPGYIVLLKIWAQVSRSDVWLRSLSVLAGLLTLIAVYLIARRVANRKGALMATTLLALSGYHIRFSQEARTYALSALVTAIAILAVAQLIAQPDGDSAERVRGSRPWSVRSDGLGLRRPLTWTDLAWPGYTMAAGVAFLLHNTGLAVAVAANVAVVIWWLTQSPKPPRFARNWVVGNVVVVAIWMLWVPGFVNQAAEITADWWVPAPTVLSVAEGGADLAAPSFGLDLFWNGQTPWAVVVVVAALALVWMGTRSMVFGHKVMVWAFLLTLPVIELAYSLIRPIFLTRTLVGVLVPATVAVGVAVTRRRRHWYLAVALLGFSVLGTVAYHASHEKTAWDEAAAMVAASAGPDTLVLVQPANTVVAFSHYFEDDQVDVYGAPSRLPERVDRGPSVTVADRDLVAALARVSGDVWLVLNRPDEGDSLEATLDGVLADSEPTRLHDLVVIHYRG